MSGHKANKRTSKQLGSVLVASMIVLIVTLLACPIIWALGSSLVSASTAEITDWFTLTRGWMLMRSIAIAALLAAATLVLGIPLSAILKSGSARGSALLLTPIWLPSILVYAAFNMLRSPESMMGSQLIDLASHGHRWAPIWAGYILASAGLALWASPIAAVLMAAGSERSGVLAQQLSVERVGRLTKLKLWIGARRGMLLRVWIVLAVLFLGSAVPMHLAQFDTWSIVLWRELSERGPDTWGTVWIGSTPMLLAALFGAWMIVRSIGGIESSESRNDSTAIAPMRVAHWIKLLAWSVWILAVLLPLLAMIWSLDDLRSIGEFWRVQGGAVRSSAGVAGIAAGVSVMIGIGIAYMLGHPSSALRRLAKCAVFTLAVLGLVPGVLVGAAVASWMIDGYWAVVLAACIRTACVGAIVGALCSAGEPGSRRALRWMDGNVGVIGWAQTQLTLVWVPLVGSGIAAALVSLYEIEASVMVRPPGMENLPQQLLSDLHYARLEALSAAGVNLLGLGIVIGGGATLCMLRIPRTKSNQSSTGE